MNTAIQTSPLPAIPLPAAPWLTPALARDLAAGRLQAESPAWLQRYTTFRLGGPTPLLLQCPLPEQVRHAWTCLRQHGAPLLLIGGGSNLLISDLGLDLAIIRCAETPVSQVQRAGSRLRVPAGVSLDDLARLACELGLDGLVNCSGIPGTVGGAIVGNAGAWGWQVGDALVSATLLQPDGTVAEVPARDLGFAYRDSRLKHNGDLLLEGTFELPNAAPAALLSKRAEILALRAEKHPHLGQYPCAGSFFRNLEPTSKAERRQAAGAFLEQAGAKGMRQGEAMVFAKHANIIVKGGPNCQAQEVYELACRMAAAVRVQFQLDLVREVRLLGQFRDAAGQLFDATGQDT